MARHCGSRRVEHQWITSAKTITSNRCSPLIARHPQHQGALIGRTVSWPSDFTNVTFLSTSSKMLSSLAPFVACIAIRIIRRSRQCDLSITSADSSRRSLTSRRIPKPGRPIFDTSNISDTKSKPSIRQNSGSSNPRRPDPPTATVCQFETHACGVDDANKPNPLAHSGSKSCFHTWTLRVSRARPFLISASGLSMRRTVQQQSEDQRLQAYMDQYQFSEAVIQIYRLGENQDGKRWRKRTKVGTIMFDETIDLCVAIQRQF